MNDAIKPFTALDKFRAMGKCKNIACCPAHDDKTPSLSITDSGDKVLFHCFAGCSQADVLDALTTRGIWCKTSAGRSGLKSDELEYMTHYCLVWNGSVRRGLEVPEQDTHKMDLFLRALSIHAPDHYRRVVEDAGHER